MNETIGRLADSLLALLVPRAEAAAACPEYWRFCRCDSEGIVWRQRCGGGCSGIPSYCYPCQERPERC